MNFREQYTLMYYSNIFMIIHGHIINTFVNSFFPPRFPVGSGWFERIVISVGCKSASKVISRREQHILNLICYKSNAIR